jgi:hypothetical protein
MNSKELYCFVSDLCDTLPNENAPISSRGVIGVSWRHQNDVLAFIIIELHVIICNALVELYV